MKTTRSESRAEVPGAVSESVRGLHRIFQNVDLFSRRALRQFGVSGPQIWALRTIRDAECTTMSDLARRLHLHPSTVSGIIDRLEGRGLALRLGAANDARGIGSLSSDELACVHRAVQILSRIMDVPDPSGGGSEPRD